MAQVKAKLVKENKEALLEIMINAAQLNSAADRMKVCQWIQKLYQLNVNDFAQLDNQSEYLQYLKVMLRGDYKVLANPFNFPPPEFIQEAFAIIVANRVADAIPDIPRAGSIRPVLMHKSLDDRAFMFVERTFDNGLLCYMAVTPDAKADNSENKKDKKDTSAVPN